MPDNLAAQLAEWGEDFEEELNRAAAEEDDSLKRSLSLLGAVEAALKLADDWGQVSALHGYECAAALRAAITAALAGTQPGEDGDHG